MTDAEKWFEEAKKKARIGKNDSIRDLFAAAANWEYLNETETSDEQLQKEGYYDWDCHAWGDTITEEEIERFESVEEVIECAESAADSVVEEEMEFD